MEDKSKLQKGVGQIKEGMGKISEGVGNIVETKVVPDTTPKAHKPFITAEEALRDQRLADAAKAANPKTPMPASKPLWKQNEEQMEGAKTQPKEMWPAKPVPPIAPFTPPSGQMPAPEVAPVVAAKPDPKPVPNAPNVKKGEGITYIGKYKKFHAEFKASGQTYNVGMYDTEAQAIAEIARAKSHLYP